MRSQVLRRHARLLSQAGLITVLAVSATACSSDFTRFDRTLTSALPQPAQQSSNAYPGDVDPMTTASVSRTGAASGAPVPIGQVATPVVEPDHGGYQPYASYSAQPSAPQPGHAGGVERRELPQPVASGTQVDRTTTASVARPAMQPTPQPAPIPAAAAEPVVEDSDGGWSRAGGTAITLRSGETLYNISKRYGVPVREIMRANQISDADSVQAGQRIVIPTYVYSSNAPVSAPDNDPRTRASRASTGMIGQASGVPGIPQKRPKQMAAVDTAGSLNAQRETIEQRYKPVPRTQEQNLNNQLPDYSVVTGSVSRAVPMDGYYTVKSGDTLSGIAASHGTTTSALIEANRLDNATIRVGQALLIPTGQPSPAGSQTASGPVQGPKPYVKPTLDSAVTGSVDATAPERTGIATLRWPVNGRVISGFGEQRRNGRNDGIDISVPEGTPVRAAENGVVIYSGSDLEGFGNLILIRHEGGLVTAYAHNKSNQVAKGAQVRRGDQIALSGRTGNAPAPMLHFEVRKDAQPVNPEKYLGG